MKYYAAILICFIAACIQLPQIRNGKLDASKTQNVLPWQVDEYVDDAMRAKGYEKPKANLDDESALWIWIAGLCALGAVGCFVAGYMTSMNRLCIVAAMLGACALVATVVSAAIGVIVWIVGPMLLVGLCYLGWKLRNHKIQAFR